MIKYINKIPILVLQNMHSFLAKNIHLMKMLSYSRFKIPIYYRQTNKQLSDLNTRCHYLIYTMTFQYITRTQCTLVKWKCNIRTLYAQKILILSQKPISCYSYQFYYDFYFIINHTL